MEDDENKSLYLSFVISWLQERKKKTGFSAQLSAYF